MPRRLDLPALRRADLAADPIDQFGRWYAAAEREVPLCDAISLATADSDGAPDARMVLLKGFGADGFHFHTNHESAKGRQLAANPRAALVVYWREMDRQVRVRGVVAKLAEADSDRYFASRPPQRQLGAWASPQSRPLRDHAELEQRLAEVAAQFGNAAVTRPPHWGGFVLRPGAIEFWQGVAERLHDRFLYERDGDEGWRITRLAP